MKLKIIKFAVCIFFIASLVVAPLALAQNTNAPASTTPEANSVSSGVKSFGQTAFGQDEPPSVAMVAALIINAFLILLGIIFTILIIYGGYTWMTAMGVDEKIKKAKQTIVNAGIGLIIIIISYAIVDFVFELLSQNSIFLE